MTPELYIGDPHVHCTQSRHYQHGGWFSFPPLRTTATKEFPFSDSPRSTPEALVPYIKLQHKLKGLNFLCITDHRYVALEEVRTLQDLLQDYPVKVILGCEFVVTYPLTDQKTREKETRQAHLVGIGLEAYHGDPQEILPAQEMASRIRDQGGMVFVPHTVPDIDPEVQAIARNLWRRLYHLWVERAAMPLSYVEKELLEYVDTIELNGSVPNVLFKSKILTWCAEHNLASTAASDMHNPADLANMVTIFAKETKDALKDFSTAVVNRSVRIAGRGQGPMAFIVSLFNNTSTLVGIPHEKLWLLGLQMQLFFQRRQSQLSR